MAFTSTLCMNNYNANEQTAKYILLLLEGKLLTNLQKLCIEQGLIRFLYNYIDIKAYLTYTPAIIFILC